MFLLYAPFKLDKLNHACEQNEFYKRGIKLGLSVMLLPKEERYLNRRLLTL